jgi:hypothetical protein
MLGTHSKVSRYTSIVVLSVLTALSCAAISQQDTPKSTSRQASQPTQYFPEGVVASFTRFFAEYLQFFDEPSLLPGAQDRTVVSYRFESWMRRGSQILVVRLSLNPDGSARVVTVDQSGNPAAVHRTERTAPAVDVKKFLELIEKANFWSTSTIDNNQRQIYDGVPWIFEGLRDGKYHVVIRDDWPSSPSNELLRYLTIDLGKVDASGIPR